jgi:hypothetical protein
MKRYVRKFEEKTIILNNYIQGELLYVQHSINVRDGGYTIIAYKNAHIMRKDMARILELGCTRISQEKNELWFYFNGDVTDGYNDKILLRR